MKARLAAVVHREGEWFVSWCPDLDVASRGLSIEESLANLREALELRLEDEDVHLPEEPFLLTTLDVARTTSRSASG